MVGHTACMGKQKLNMQYQLKKLKQRNQLKKPRYGWGDKLVLREIIHKELN
jgi:hypothetical protein